MIEVGKGWLSLLIDDGFPDPLSIFDPTWDQGRYLRKYRKVGGECQILEEDENVQVSWSGAIHLGGNNWNISLTNHNLVTGWMDQAVVGIKSKCCGNGRGLYTFHHSKMPCQESFC